MKQLIIKFRCRDSCPRCPDQEVGEHPDGHRQQDPVERLSHGSASQRPRGGVVFPSPPWERKCVPCCNTVMTHHSNVIYSSELLRNTPLCSGCNHFHSTFVFFFSAFCRQDEIESRLLKIEGLITSLGKHIHSSEKTSRKLITK